MGNEESATVVVRDETGHWICVCIFYVGTKCLGYQICTAFDSLCIQKTYVLGGDIIDADQCQT